MRTLYLERPSFWTETRDGEAWFRALGLLSGADSSQLVGSPRAVWQRMLSKTLSRRTALGLFGASPVPEGALLYGAGLMVHSGPGWLAHDEAHELSARWQEASPGVLEDFARFLLKESVWLRCLLCRLLDGDWTLTDWQRVRGRQKGIKPGESLGQLRFAESDRWLEGLEQRAAGRWLLRTECSQLAVLPDVLSRASRRDDLSLAPLTAPLHLLESLGWLTATGDLRLPTDLRDDLDQVSAADRLSQISSAHADIRGFVPVEPVLRELLAASGADPDHIEFARWMDELVGIATSEGAIEILAAEPGQSRHGRGLFGDPTRKLVRWVVHSEFSDCFRRAWTGIDSSRNVPNQSKVAEGKELTR